MNTVEELFTAATTAMEDRVLVPTIMSKLAERGYTPQTQEETEELLKHAEIIRNGLLSGEIVPIPASQFNANGELAKEASDKADKDFLAFAPEVNIDLNQVEPVVKEAATVLAWGFMQAEREQTA